MRLTPEGYPEGADWVLSTPLPMLASSGLDWTIGLMHQVDNV